LIYQIILGRRLILMVKFKLLNNNFPPQNTEKFELQENRNEQIHSTDNLHIDLRKLSRKIEILATALSGVKESIVEQTSLRAELIITKNSFSSTPGFIYSQGITYGMQGVSRGPKFTGDAGLSDVEISNNYFSGLYSAGMAVHESSDIRIVGNNLEK